jgi:hypothetical protein
MHLYGSGTDVELIGDFAVVQPLCDIGKDFLLAAGDGSGVLLILALFCLFIS